MFLFSKSNAPLNNDEDNDVEIIWDSNSEDHHYDEELDSSESPDNTKTRRRPRTWKDSHDRYCRQRHCLRATINQILNDDEKEASYQVSWDLPTPQEVVTTVHDPRLRIGHVTKDDDGSLNKTLPPSSSSTTAVQQLAKSLVHGIYSTAIYMTGHASHAMTNENEDDDDDYRAVHASSSAVDCNDKIIHVELTQQCLSRLLEAVAQMKSQSLKQEGGGSSCQRGPWILLTRSDWSSWARTMIGTNPFSLSVEDIQWLLEVLVAQQHAQILQRPNKPDLVLLLTMDRLTTEFQWNEKHNPDLQISLALFDLEQARVSMERQIEQWTEQQRDCSTKALAYRQQGQEKLALVQMAKRKSLQQHIDTSAMMLLQLEQVYASIEMAQSNQAVVELLSQGSQLLHQLSTETTLDIVDQIHEDLQDAMDHVNHVQERLTITTTMTTTAGTEISDDDLLAELAALTIQQDEELIAVVTPPVHPNDVQQVSKASSTRPKGESKTSTVDALT